MLVRAGGPRRRRRSARRIVDLAEALGILPPPRALMASAATRTTSARSRSPTPPATFVCRPGVGTTSPCISADARGVARRDQRRHRVRPDPRDHEPQHVQQPAPSPRSSSSVARQGSSTISKRLIAKARETGDVFTRGPGPVDARRDPGRPRRAGRSTRQAHRRLGRRGARRAGLEWTLAEAAFANGRPRGDSIAADGVPRCGPRGRRCRGCSWIAASSPVIAPWPNGRRPPTAPTRRRPQRRVRMPSRLERATDDAWPAARRGGRGPGGRA